MALLDAAHTKKSGSTLSVINHTLAQLLPDPSAVLWSPEPSADISLSVVKMTDCRVEGVRGSLGQLG